MGRCYSGVPFTVELGIGHPHKALSTASHIKIPSANQAMVDFAFFLDRVFGGRQSGRITTIIWVKTDLI